MAIVSEKILEEVSSDFKGNLLINSRTITNTNQFFQEIKKSSSKSGMSVSQLSELLVLIESISTSKQLVYDGTVPAREIEKVACAEEELEAEVGDRGVFTGIKPDDNEQLLEVCSMSIKQSTLLIQERIQKYITDPVKAKKELQDVRLIDEKTASDFAKELLQSKPPKNEYKQYTTNLIAENPFNGAKCVAGLIASSMDDDLRDIVLPGKDLYGQCKALLKNRSAKELSWLVPMLINSFRANFLNILGGDYAEAAFFAGGDIERVKGQQVLLLSNYMAEIISRDKLEPYVEESKLRNCLTNSSQFPFLGLITFLSAEEDNPYNVFTEALKYKNELFSEFMPNKAEGIRYIHDFDSMEMQEFKSKKLDETCQRIQKKIAWNETWERTNRGYIQPAITNYPLIEKSVKLINGIGLIEFTLPELDGLEPSGLDYAIKKLFLNKEFYHYASFTHRINGKLKTVLNNDETVAGLINNKVNTLFGCELRKD